VNTRRAVKGGVSALPEPKLGDVPRIAIVTLALFLFAVLVALGITLISVSLAARVLAIAAVSPIVALAVIFLLMETQRRPRGFVGGGVLGILGVGLRLVINTQPQFEVGGGLPAWVTAFYLAIGALVIGTSFWAYLEVGNNDR
jgi:hypothetical protein